MNHSIYRVPGYVADEHVEDVQKKIAKAVDDTRTEEAIAHPSYSGPNTIEQWWALVDEWWAELLSITEKYVKLDKPVEKDGKMLGINGYIHMAQLKQERDPKLVGYFDTAWCNAPDVGWIHAQRGWGVLCDLCSEQWVFDPEPSGEDE